MDMRTIQYIKIMALFFVLGIMAISCEKDDLVTLDPKVDTWEITEVTSTSAVLSGLVVAQGDGFSEYGVCWATAPAPTVDGSKQVVDSITGAVYRTKVTGLEHFTKYYVRAYVKQTSGEYLYGSDTTFTTLAHIPSVTIKDASEITATTAIFPVEVTYDGKSSVTMRGLCWSVSENPTTDGSKTENGEGTGAFNDTLTGLVADSTYYVRAYATNAIGTAYSSPISFKTSIGVATVVTISAKSQTTTAQVQGAVIYDGGASVTERGVVWGTSEDPTISDNKVIAEATDTFEVELTGLTPGTEYYVRAYATNNEGTAYGDNISFIPGAMFMIGDGVGNWVWGETDLPMVPVYDHPSIYWKIVWMNTTGGFKIAPEKAWGSDMGKTGDATNGVYSIGSDNVPVPGTEGYYMVVIDIESNTIEVTDPQVYGIGDAFGGWDGAVPDNLFTVDNATEVIKFGGIPSDGNLRMYVTASTLACDWWQAEFNVIGGNIEFRGRGGEQTAVPVTSGQTVTLNFKAGTGSIAD
jgi:hypothetical protein